MAKEETNNQQGSNRKEEEPGFFETIGHSLTKFGKWAFNLEGRVPKDEDNFTQLTSQDLIDSVEPANYRWFQDPEDVSLDDKAGKHDNKLGDKIKRGAFGVASVVFGVGTAIAAATASLPALAVAFGVAGVGIGLAKAGIFKGINKFFNEKIGKLNPEYVYQRIGKKYQELEGRAREVEARRKYHGEVLEELESEMKEKIYKKTNEKFTNFKDLGSKKSPEMYKFAKMIKDRFHDGIPKKNLATHINLMGQGKIIMDRDAYAAASFMKECFPDKEAQAEYIRDCMKSMQNEDSFLKVKEAFKKSFNEFNTDKEINIDKALENLFENMKRYKDDRNVSDPVKEFTKDSRKGIVRMDSRLIKQYDLASIEALKEAHGEVKNSKLMTLIEERKAKIKELAGRRDAILQRREGLGRMAVALIDNMRERDSARTQKTRNTATKNLDAISEGAMQLLNETRKAESQEVIKKSADIINKTNSKIKDIEKHENHAKKGANKMILFGDETKKNTKQQGNVKQPLHIRLKEAIETSGRRSRAKQKQRNFIKKIQQKSSR